MYFGINNLKDLPTPTLDISDALTPEAQKPENIEQQKEIEKDFNISQGFVPIEDNKEFGEISSNEIIGFETKSESNYSDEVIVNDDFVEKDDTDPIDNGE